MSGLETRISQMLALHKEFLDRLKPTESVDKERDAFVNWIRTKKKSSCGDGFSRR